MRPRMSVARCCCAGVAPPIFGAGYADGNWSPTRFNAWQAASRLVFGHQISQLPGTTPREDHNGYLWVRDVPVAQGALITSATISLNLSGPIAAPWSYAITEPDGTGGFLPGAPGNFARCRIFAEDSDDPLEPTSSADANSRPRTATFVDDSFEFEEFTVPPDVLYTFPNIAALVQDIVNRPTWVSGNNMLFFFEDNNGDDNYLCEFYPGAVLPSGFVWELAIIAS